MNKALIEELLSHVVKAPDKAAERLIDYFGSFTAIAEAEAEEIRDALDGDMATAIYLKLSIALAARRESDKLVLGKKHTEEEIKKHFVAFFFGMSVETVAVMSFDGSGKVLAVDKAGEGTVNFSNVMPRKILEIAKRRKAKCVAIAHNHPGGYSIPSDDDVASSNMLSEMLLISGIRVFANYVVAGNECTRIGADNDILEGE